MESGFLYGPRKDEALNVYNLAKFEPEVMILNKLFEGEEPGINDKHRLQSIAHADKLNEAAVFFGEFLENLNQRKGRALRLPEAIYCFARDMLYRIFQRRLLEKGELGLLFRIVYQFQFLRFELNNTVRRARDDLVTDELFRNDDFWLHALYAIFASYKNKKEKNGFMVKEMLILNFASLREVRQSERAALDIMKKVISLSLGFSIEQILDEMEARPKTPLTLIFYREQDIETRKQLQIFT